MPPLRKNKRGPESAVDKDIRAFKREMEIALRHRFGGDDDRDSDMRSDDCITLACKTMEWTLANLAALDAKQMKSIRDVTQWCLCVARSIHEEINDGDCVDQRWDSDSDSDSQDAENEEDPVNRDRSSKYYGCCMQCTHHPSPRVSGQTRRAGGGVVCCVEQAP